MPDAESTNDQLQADATSMTAPRFCVIDIDCSKAWLPITFSDMFRGCLEKPGDQWTTCSIAAGEELPADILSYQGVVLTGSRFNCRDRANLPWFEPLSDFIRQAAEKGYPRVYGGCFGCQLIAFALGGEVDYNPSRNFVLKAEDIKWCACDCKCSADSINEHTENTDERCCTNANGDDNHTENHTNNGNNNRCDCCSSLPFSQTVIQKLQSSQGLHILVSHGDCVCKVPDSALLIARSESCAAEMFLAGSRKNILASQSHPELDFDYAIRDRIWPVVVDQRKRLSAAEIALAQDTFARYTGADAKFFMDAVSDYLHGHFHKQYPPCCHC